MKKQKCCDNLINKEAKKTKYTDNNVHENIDPKLQNMSEIQVLIMVLSEEVKKQYPKGFH